MIGNIERKRIDNIYYNEDTNEKRKNTCFNDNIESMYELYLSRQVEYPNYAITMLITIDSLLSKGYTYDQIYEYIMEPDCICDGIDDDTDYFYRKAAVKLLKMRSRSR